MRILVEPSDYVLRNVGDMAMLRSAIDLTNHTDMPGILLGDWTRDGKGKY